MNIVKLIVALSLTIMGNAYGRAKCELTFFEELGQSLLVSKESDGSLRLCEYRDIKLNNLTFHAYEDARIYSDADKLWISHLKVTRDFLGRRTLHQSGIAFFKSSGLEIHLVPESRPFEFRLEDGQVHLCDGLVEDLGYPNGRLDGEFDNKGNLRQCHIDPKKITLKGQEVVIQDRIWFHEDGSVSDVELVPGSSWTLHFPPSAKSLTFFNYVWFTTDGDVYKAEATNVPFAHKGRNYLAEKIEISTWVSIEQVLVSHIAEFYVQGLNPSKLVNGMRYSIEKKDVNEYVKLYEKLCQKMNPLNGELTYFFPMGVRIYHSEFVQEESFHDIKTGEVRIKRQEQVYVPLVDCKYKLQVDYKDIPQYLL